MPNDTTRRLTGITSFRDPEAGTTMASAEDVTIAPDRVSCQIGPLSDREAGRKIVSLDRSVIQYQHRIMNAREAQAYKLSGATPAPKPERARRSTMACPLCLGTREEDTGTRHQMCRQCGGTGRIERP